mgnify:CR=1 FL=1
MSLIGIRTIIPDIVNLPGQTGEGISANFSYSKSSFRQDESDPTPTITGTQGGTFTSSPSGLTINSSTGTIDLENSSLGSYTITYTVQGVSAQQSLSVIQPLTIDNNFSMEFDGVASYFKTFDTAQSGDFSFSFWIKADGTYTNYAQYVPVGIRTINVYQNRTIGRMYKFASGPGLTFMSQMRGPDGSPGSFDNYYINGFDFTTKDWVHVAFTYELTTRRVYIYLDGQAKQWTKFTGGTTSDYITTVPSDSYNFDLEIGAWNQSSLFFPGKIDETAIWSSVLSEETIKAIYDATANNPGKVADLSQTPEGAPAAWYRMGD